MMFPFLQKGQTSFHASEHIFIMMLIIQFCLGTLRVLTEISLHAGIDAYIRVLFRSFLDCVRNGLIFGLRTEFCDKNLRCLHTTDLKSDPTKLGSRRIL
jgi:hypothetical protein